MVKRTDSTVLCLEEIATAQRETVRRFGIAAGVTSAQALEGFARLSQGARVTSIALTGPGPAEELAGMPVVHAFTPDLDLRCSVRGCGLGPEEHELW